MADRHDLFRGALGPGVHRLDPPVAADELAESVAGHGWVALVVDLTGAGDKVALLDAFAAAGRFPDWWGRNWDALADLLGDLSWLGPADGYAVVLDAWDAFASTDPADAEVLESILGGASSTWSERGTPFVAVVSGG